MVIYSHNLHEKLFGYAISREFIKYQTPFCDLLDDPTLSLDFDLAIGFNQAINGITNLKLIGKNAWSESQTMLTKDSLPELIEKAQSGESLRTNTSGYRYTPDIKSYFDLNGIASAILGGVASDMGDCFRRYQQSVRYNPYDPKQNQSFVSRAPIVDQVNGTTYYRTSLGQSIDINTGGELQSNLGVNEIGNKRVVVTADTVITQSYNFNPPGRGGTGELTAYTSLLEGNKFLTDGMTDPDTQAGRTAFPKNVPLLSPNSYTVYKRYVNEGKTNNADLAKLDKGKFNNGFAMNIDFLCKLIGNNFRRGDVYKIMNGKQSDKWIYAEITPPGGSKYYVQLIDTNTAKGSATALDLTVFAWNTVFPSNKIVATSKVNLQEADGSGIEQYTYRSAPAVSAKVRIIVGKVSDVSAAPETCGQDSQEKINKFVQGAKAAVNDWKTYTSNQIPIPSGITATLQTVETSAANYGKETNADTKFCLYTLAANAAASVYQQIGSEYAKFAQFGQGDAAQKAKVKQAGEAYTSAGNDLQKAIDSCPKSAQCK